MLAPREIGEAEPTAAFFDVVEAAASADGSVGWVVMIGGCYATFGGLLSPEGAAEIFGDPSTISAGAFRPEGTAIEVDGSYHVTGRWSLGSGLSHANWFIAGCVVTRDGKPVRAPDRVAHRSCVKPLSRGIGCSGRRYLEFDPDCAAPQAELSIKKRQDSDETYKHAVSNLIKTRNHPGTQSRRGRASDKATIAV